jgi:CxxC-x17-CxxC domain-containing protein
MDNSYRGNRSGGNFNRRRDFGSRDRGPRRTEMFPAVCDNCGKDCEVPFRPSSDKPIYCSKCFEDVAPRRDDRAPRRDNSSSFKPRDNSSDISQLKDQLGSISGKLDKIIRLLSPVEVEEIVEVKKEEKPKKVAKKTTKKTTAKPKKTTTKKKKTE